MILSPNQTLTTYVVPNPKQVLASNPDNSATFLRP